MKTYEELFEKHERKLRRRRVVWIVVTTAIIVLSALAVWYVGFIYEPEPIYIDQEGNIVEVDGNAGGEGVLS